MRDFYIFIAGYVSAYVSYIIFVGIAVYWQEWMFRREGLTRVGKPREWDEYKPTNTVGNKYAFRCDEGLEMGSFSYFCGKWFPYDPAPTVDSTAKAYQKLVFDPPTGKMIWIPITKDDVGTLKWRANFDVIEKGTP